MAIKDILLMLDITRATSPATEAAVELAGRVGAHLTGVGLAIDPVVPGFVVAPLPVELIESARADAIKAAETAIGRFEEAARRQGVAAEARMVEILMGGAPDSFLVNCRLTDLVVVGQDDPSAIEPMRDTMIEAALFEGTAPLLIVPHIHRGPIKFDRVMVGWDGSRTAARAVHAALPILELAGTVQVVIVGLDDGQGQAGADVATWLARHGVKVEIEQIVAPDIGVGDALLNHASDKNMDLLVMGGYGHSRLREFLIGGATRSLLSTMTLPVLMAH